MSKTIGLITANYTSEYVNKNMESRPLAALPFGGRYRLIDFPLSNMTNSGISQVGLILPFNNRSLIDHVGTGKAWGFGRKTHSMFLLPGSAYGKRSDGSKFLLRDFIKNLRFFNYDQADYLLVSASNRVYSMDYRPLIEQHEKTGAQITKVYHGKEFMDCFILDISFLNDISDWFSNLDYMDLITIIDDYLPDSSVGHFEYIGYEHVVDTLNDYFEANMDLLKGPVAEMVFESTGTVYTNIQDRCPTYFSPAAVVKNSVIAAGSIIEGTVENSIIFRSSHIYEGAVVKNCVLMQHAEIKEDTELKYFVCDKRVTVSPGTRIIGTKDSPNFARKGTTI